MENQIEGSGIATFQFIACLGLAVQALWLVIGWRAMSAHEKLARAVESMTRARGSEAPPDSRPE